MFLITPPGDGCNSKRVPGKMVVVGCQQVASALAHMHSTAVGTVHQDVHAKNVTSTRDSSSWKLIDMGCASQMFHDDGNPVLLNHLTYALLQTSALTRLPALLCCIPDKESASVV